MEVAELELKPLLSDSRSLAPDVSPSYSSHTQKNSYEPTVQVKGQFHT